MNLDEFAEKQGTTKTGRRCMTCNLSPDVLDQIEQARQREPKPVSFEIITKWLKEDQGITMHANTVRNHFIAGHDHD